jgi:DNA-binding transcriptional LysR family regulator
MDLTHLRYFQVIATCGSLTAAARVLRVSQPALTVAMHNLEERFGTTLLLRERTGVRLTTTGEELLRHAAEMFALVERAEQQIKGLESGDVGNFVVGCHESLGAYFLPDFMASFLREAPRIEISLWNGSSDAVQRAVLDRRVHFGIVVNASPHPDLVIVEMFHDAVDLFVACDAGVSPASGRLDRLGGHAPLPSGFEEACEVLRAGPLIFAGRVQQCQQIIDQLAASAALPSRLLSCGDFELVKSLTLSGVGVGLLPRRVARYNQEGKLRRLHERLPFFPDTISLVYRADTHRTRAALRLKDELIVHGKGLDR